MSLTNKIIETDSVPVDSRANLMSCVSKPAPRISDAILSVDKCFTNRCLGFCLRHRSQVQLLIIPSLTPQKPNWDQDELSFNIKFLTTKGM